MELGSIDSVSAFRSHVDPRRAERIKARMAEVNVQRLLTAVRPVLSGKSFDVVFEFFAHHVFMPADRAGRDRAIEDVYEKMKSVSVMDFANNLRDTVELTRLANQLDDSLVAILSRRHHGAVELIGAAEIDAAILEENAYADRRRQVELLLGNMRFFHRVSNITMARFMLPSMKMFAKATGVACLVDQIDAGYRAARAITDIDGFVVAIHAQECGRLDELFGKNDAN